MKYGSRWSGEENQTLRDLRAQGVPVNSIAETLGRSVDSVKARVGRAGLQRRPRRYGRRK